MSRPVRLVLLAAVVMLLPLTALAHPGRTDGSGGHTDLSSGEYHYHHGYSAHQHYDMDGDGIVDCPYDFDDQTDHDSGSSDNSSNNYVYDQPTTRSTVPPIVMTTAPAEEAKTTEEVKIVPNWVYWVFFILACIIFFMWSMIRSRDTEIETMRNRHYSELDEIKKKHEKELRSVQEKGEKELRSVQEKGEKELRSAQEKVEKNLSAKSASDQDLAAANERLSKAKGEYRSVFTQLESAQKELESIKKQRKMYAEAPPDVTFTKEGLPVYWKPDKNKPYGDYTVYISLRSNIYHTDRFCASYISRAAHLFDVMDRHRPCKKCAENAFGFNSVPNWYDPR